MFWPCVIFEELGLKYYGPIDGHDIATLIKTFEFLKTQDRPVFLHVLTQKGKGFEPAMQKQKKFHGLGPYDPETGETKSSVSVRIRKFSPTRWSSWRTRNDKVVAITARDAQRHWRWTVSAPLIPTSILMSASRKNTRCFSPPVWPPRDLSPSAPSIPLFCSARLIPLCTTCACRISR